MSMLQRARLKNELIAKGWRRSPDGTGLIPPKSLWDNKPKQFNTYDAKDIQDLLEPDEEE